MEIKFFEIENSVKFIQGHISVFEIENKNLFKNIILHLYQITQGESDNISINIIENDKVENFKNYELVTNIFSINESAINNKLIKYLNTELECSEYQKDILDILEQLKNTFLHYFDDIPFDLCYNDNVTIVDLLKDFAPKINNQVNFNYLDMLNNYIKAIKMLKINDIIIFVDLKKYLTSEELKNFYENVFMLDLSVLLIESCRSEIIEGYEWKINIDNDLYETVLL